ncbi:DUF2683 family protein [Candidatus Woesearchaeota archaeon]|jgi:hypothetical protein|nr:DUF2683 family protein [Candidatus Woesearchaeota archaeon]
MVKIMVNLSTEEDKIVEIYKLVHNLNSKQDAIKEMVKFFEADVVPTKLKNKEYFK